MCAPPAVTANPRGDHWRGALPQALTVLVLGVRLAMLAPRYNAVRRQQLENLR
ncbi:hypothetical protein V2J56_14395 [Georgenia sp. MJ206]|uniref:hypothetical protein n=1 Tax=Georgenia wangjunii TaxID=3117730 RepID=UPI002F264EB5